MELWSDIYVSVYVAATMLATWLIARNRREISLLSFGYRELLKRPWKLITFAIAAIGLVAIAPYTGDPTWDYVDASFMSLLTFATAPWSIGTLSLSLQGRAILRDAYVAVCLWLWTASWSYDLYILARDGHYPITWLPNLFASSVLYVSAGLLWNLDWRPNRGVIFAFSEPGWPQASESGSFFRIAGHAAPFILIAAGCVGYFFW